ncbi:MAG TPA: hypothetical protein VMR28_00845 [Candidatus Saccharimonadales bacterium]|nr:hypothetical protein [Candidatus Saccharimonadales bacterium]
MKYKIGIFGSSAGDMSISLPKAEELGQVLGQYSDKVTIITGACSGIPYAAAKVAADRGVNIWGYSPMLDLKGQRKFTPDDDISIYTKLVYVPANFEYADNDLVRKKYRNVLSTSSCDAGIIISGRWGSLNEFTNLIDLQKVVGVLTDTGGIADELVQLNKKIYKEGQGRIVFNNDPQELVNAIFTSLM